MEKAEVLNNFFCLCLHQVLRPTPLKSQQQRQDLENEEPPTVEIMFKTI